MGPMLSSKPASATQSARIPLVDAARGAALVAMVVFHLTWDLGYFALIPPQWPFDPRFLMFGDVIAASFLALVGVSLALAARDGLNISAYLRRLALVAGAAGLVTLATWWIFPDSFIFFGILHCIAAASVLALAFLRAPWPVTALAGAAIVLAPMLIGGAQFDAIQYWSGLGAVEPRSNDWRPLFPWAGFAVLGLAGAQALLRAGVPASMAQWRASEPVGRALVLGGRHSLAFYLGHQPVLFALAFLASQVLGPAPQAGPQASVETQFTRTCVAECAKAGPARDWCEQACTCVVRESKAADLWASVASEKLSAAERPRYDALTQQCLRAEPRR